MDEAIIYSIVKNTVPQKLRKIDLLLILKINTNQAVSELS